MFDTKPAFDLQDYLTKLEASENIEACEKVPCDGFGKDERYVFISYSHKDYKKVYADLARLYASDVPFFYDYKLQAGKQWDEEVRRKMKDPRCAGVIFYISENFFLSESIRKEIRFAFENANEDLPEKRLASFAVNLTGLLPSQIQENAFCNPGTPGQSIFGSTWRKKLTGFFPDNVTYVLFEDQAHLDRIIENIEVNFNIVTKSKRYDFDRALFCSGRGELRFSSGAVYKGSFENGRFSGRGILHYSNGAVYEGRWKNGEKDGRGKMIYPDGAVYDGQWKANEKSGRGKLTYSNGVTYEGRWKDDRKNGKCIYSHPDGTVYVGFWKDDKRHGRGTLKRPDGAVYEGQWENNQFNGQGTYTWPDGRRYEGEWCKGRRNGSGTMTGTDDSVYDGQWEKGKKSGTGTLTFPDGKVLSGLFENDQFIGPAE